MGKHGMGEGRRHSPSRSTLHLGTGASWMVVMVVVVTVFSMVATVEGFIKCEVLVNVSPTTFHLSTETYDATRRDGKQYQVFHCYCPTTQGESFGDNDKSTFDRDHFKSGEKDWANSSLLVVSNCSSLRVSLGSSDKNSIHNTMSGGKAGIVFMDINQLQIDNLDVGRASTGDNYNERITSLYFRNVTITSNPGIMLFEEKTEILFENVTFLQPISIVMKNSNQSGEPLFWLVNSRLSKTYNLASSGGLNPPSANKIRIENNQLITEAGCTHSDYRGSTTVKGNHLGFVVTGDLEFLGGSNLDFDTNNIDFIQNNGIKVLNYKTVTMNSNILGMPTGPSPILLQFRQINRCNIDDLPFEKIKQIQFNRNMVSRDPGNLITLDHAYQQNLTTKMSVGGTGYLTNCDCSTPTTQDNSPSSQLYLAIRSESSCFYNSLMTPRGTACGELGAAGWAPPTSAKGLLGEGGSGSVTTAVIVGAICAVVSALVTAVLVAICFKFCGESLGLMTSAKRRDSRVDSASPRSA